MFVNVRNQRRVLVLLVALALPVCVAMLDAQPPQVATVGLTPGWATFGQALPQGAATNGLQVGNLATQTDVKNTWPDGSIRFAIVTVNATTAGTFPVTPGTPSGGALAPVVPTAAVVLTIDGAAYTATLPPAPASDRWLSGPLAYEGRSIVAPVLAGRGAHPFLRVIFDTRVYNDGGGRVDVSVENMLDIAGADDVTYDVAITVNGAAGLHAGGGPAFLSDALAQGVCDRCDDLRVDHAGRGAVQPARSAARVRPLGGDERRQHADRRQFRHPANPARSTRSCPDHGGRPELAPYPDWTARYLVHTDAGAARVRARQRRSLRVVADSRARSGDWQQPSGVGSERLLSLDAAAGLWLDERAEGGGSDYIAGHAAADARVRVSDIPAAGQSPLLPGQRAPALDRLRAVPVDRRSLLRRGDGVLGELRHGPDHTRATGRAARWAFSRTTKCAGYGWALRNLADAAAYYPDASPVKAYLSQKVINNLQWLDTYAARAGPGHQPVPDPVDQQAGPMAGSTSRCGSRPTWPTRSIAPTSTALTGD